MSSGSNGSVIRYTSDFMRSLRNVDAAREVPSDIIRRYVDDEFYNSKQQFDPDRLNLSVKTDSVKENSSVKDDATLQPQQRQSWTRGCGISNQAKAESQGQSQQLQQQSVPQKLPSIQPNPGLATSARQAGIFAPNNRSVPSGLPPQSGAMRGGQKAGDFGLGYASTYRPPRDGHRPSFGRGRGGYGQRGGEDGDSHFHGNRVPPSLFHQHSGMRQGFGGFGHRGGFNQRKHASSSGDAVPEWFTNESDPFTMMDLGGELPSSSRSESPVESLGEDGVDEGLRSNNINISAQTNAHVHGGVHEDSSGNTTKQSNWEVPADKERPASQQADFTYLLWSTLQNDLNELGTKNETVVPPSEISGSKLWSVWKDSIADSTHPIAQQEQTRHVKDSVPPSQTEVHPSANFGLKGWSENSYNTNRAQVDRDDPSGVSTPRGLNANDLFAKFSSSSSGIGTLPVQPPQLPQNAIPINQTTRKSPTPTSGMSVEDLERKLLMKRQGTGAKPSSFEKEDLDKRPQPPKGFYDALTGGSIHTSSKAEESASAHPQQANAAPPNMQMQMAAAQQAILNALAAANSAGGGTGGSANLSQQKVMFANLLQQQLTATQGGGNTAQTASPNGTSSGGQQPPGMSPFFNMIPPNALAAAAAAAASASSPLMYYPQLLQQAQAAARHQTSGNSNMPLNSNKSNATSSSGGGSSRPLYPMAPPSAAFPNFPAMNPNAAALLSHLQQQQTGSNKPASPGPSQGSSSQQMPLTNPNFAAAAAAAASFMASRMGMNPNMPFPQGSNQFSTGMMPPQGSTNQSNSTNPLMSHGHHQHHQNHQPQSHSQQSHSQFQRPNHEDNQQHQQQQQMQRTRNPSPPLNVGSSSSGSKLNTSFIPTQVMMKNPHSINSPPEVPLKHQGVKSAGVSGLVRSGSGKSQPMANPSSQGSYSSVTANVGQEMSTSSAKPAKMWTAEDLERSFKNNSYSAYPPLQHSQQQQQPQHQQPSNMNLPPQRTAGSAAVLGGNSNNNNNRSQPVETAHQFSVADLLRGAASANKAAQSSSAGYT